MTEDPINGHDFAETEPSMDAPVGFVPVALTPEQTKEYMERLLRIIPNLIGANQFALDDQLPEYRGKIPFVIFTFGPGGVVYASNFADQNQMRAGVRGIVVSWDQAAEAELLTQQPAANSQPI